MAIQNDSQPAIKHTPPIGVMIPNFVIPVNPIKYRLPLNRIIPAAKRIAVLLIDLADGRTPQAINAKACVD